MTWGGWAIEGELEKGALLTTMLDELPKRNYPEGDSVFPKRSAQDELEFSAAFKAATASNERKKLSSDNGVRHSPLHALPYVQDGTCQLSQMVAVDLLHAGFLGVCKTTLNNLVYMGLIPADGLVRMQTVLDSLPIPYSIGQVPGKIQCGFSCLKGAEQMNLWLYFLPNLCRDLHPKVFKLVLCLSTALRMVSATSVSEQSLTYAHRLFILFNIRYERMFGAYACTFNMHALVHLRECALRLGPPRTHWGFPCERYYGFLTKIKNNITGVSKSIFQRSARSALTIHYEGLTGSEFPDEARTVHDGLCKTVGLYTTGHSRIAEQPARGYTSLVDPSKQLEFLSLAFDHRPCTGAEPLFALNPMMGKCVQKTWLDDDQGNTFLRQFKKLYSNLHLFSDQEIEAINRPLYYNECMRFNLGGEIIGGAAYRAGILNRKEKSCNIIVRYADHHKDGFSPYWPCRVRMYIYIYTVLHTVHLCFRRCSFFLCTLRYLQKIQRQTRQFAECYLTTSSKLNIISRSYVCL